MTGRAGGFVVFCASLAVVAGSGPALGTIDKPKGLPPLPIQQPSPALAIDSSDADRLLKDGEALNKSQKPDEARAVLVRALASARAGGLEAHEARALAALGEVELLANRNQSAKDYALEALTIAERTTDVRVVGRAQHLLGIIAERAGDFPEGRSRFGLAITIYDQLGDPRGQALARHGAERVSNLGLTEKERLLDEAIRYAKAAGDRRVEGGAFHSWGDRLFTAGQYERALEKLESAERLYDSPDAAIDLGTVYNSMGRLYRAHGQVEIALSYQQKALAIHQRTASRFNHLQSLNAVAVTYQALGDWRSSRAYLERALDLARQSSTPRIQDFIGANLASTLIEEGEYERGAQVLEGVLARALDVYPSVRYGQLADAYLRLGRLDAALETSDKAVELCGGRDDLACFHAFERRADAHAARGNAAAELADRQLALEVIERARKRLIPSDFFKQQFGRAQTSAYGRTIEMQLGQGQTREALETAELARSRAFLDLLASRDEKQSGAEAARPSADAFPLHRRSSVNAPPATTEGLVAEARRLQSTLLVYWVNADQVFIWTVQPGGEIQSRRVAVRESKLAEMVRATAPIAAQRDARAVRPARQPSVWRDLHDLLIRPIRSSLPHAPGALITIVPHGPLAMLSFASLQNEQGRYLLEDYTLHYVPAGAVLEFTGGASRASAKSGQTLIVADPVLPRRSPLDRRLPALPGARAEARAIARFAPSDQVTMLEGGAATESGVRGNAAGKAVLHFAAHAIVSDADPFGSFLALGRSSSESQGDGILTAQEIYGLDLQADLVVLAACRSGGGRVTGDGMATFARAFLYAGTPSLITSVWDVADEPTARLLPEFYRGWKRGASKARALRDAQLSLLHSLRAGLMVETAAGSVVLPEHPALWAGFMLIGEPD